VATGTDKPVLVLTGKSSEDVRSVVSLEIRRSGREAALPFGVQFKNARIIRFCLPSTLRFMECCLIKHRDDLTFTYRKQNCMEC
jgi:hypothetical protein